MKRGTPDLWIDRCPACGTERYFTPVTEGERRCVSCPYIEGDDEPCPECGHASDAHGVEGCEAGGVPCPCPFHPSDILPMTQEQRAEFDRNRRRQP